MLNRLAGGIRRGAIRARFAGVPAFYYVSRGHSVADVAGIVVWFGLVLILGFSVINVSEASPGEPALWPGSRWRGLITIALAILAFLFFIAFLWERQVRIKAQNATTEGHAELLRTSRLAVVGQLSASIAHEINQPLGAILSNADAAELMLAKADPDLDEVRLILVDVRKDGLRASEVVRQVRSLAHKRHPEFLEVDLEDLSRDILHLIIPIATRRGVTIMTGFDSKALRVHGDPVLLRQAILNLLLNAMDALADMPESQAMVELKTNLSPLGEVEVAVRDSGRGLPKEHLNRVFDTFYTTKPDGLGLGLPIVRSIIEAHEGRIQAENHPDGGAVFRFTIPALGVADADNNSAGEPA